jgi:hypothetical protein
MSTSDRVAVVVVHGIADQRPGQTARRRPGTPSGFYQAQKPQEPKRQETESKDLGIALNDYLLGRLVLPEGDALYESTRVSLRRRADDRALDVYEMYWADLSRLSAGGLSALLSLYQLFFHLNTLAADVVDQASLSRNGGTAWRLLQRLHAWMAWLLKGPTALLQLAMLLMVPFGTAALVPGRKSLAAGEQREGVHRAVLPNADVGVLPASSKKICKT